MSVLAGRKKYIYWGCSLELLAVCLHLLERVRHFVQCSYRAEYLGYSDIQEYLFHADIINTDNRCLSINIACKLNIMHQPTGKLYKQGILFY